MSDPKPKIYRQDDGDNEELTIALGDDNEFLGEVMDHSPVTSPYEEAPILEIHSDAWAFERPEFSQLNTLQLYVVVVKSGPRSTLETTPV